MKLSQKILGGILLNADVKGSMNERTIGQRSVNGQAAGGLIIFPDVSPGVYELARIRGAASGGVVVPGEKVLDYVFRVKAGEPKYFGVVTVEQITTLIDFRVDFGLKPSSKEEEIAAWEKFISLYPGSLWANAVQKRISELKQ